MTDDDARLLKAWQDIAYCKDGPQTVTVPRIILKALLNLIERNTPE